MRRTFQESQTSYFALDEKQFSFTAAFGMRTMRQHALTAVR